MAGIDRQQHALEVLKCINKAITNLRLFPEQSVQVTNTIEKAYSELKMFLRLYETLCFGVQKGVPTLDGVLFERKGREQLAALTLVDFLEKAGLEVMILAQGIDRKKFKQLLSFFTANPEQVHKAGGSVAFVKKSGLESIFLKKSGEVVGPQEHVGRSFGDYLQQMVAEGLRQEDILTFFSSTQGRQLSEMLRRDRNDFKRCVFIFAGAVCYALKSLQQAGGCRLSSDFDTLLANTEAALTKDESRKLADGAATLLTAHLDSASLCLLFCQAYTTPFGQVLFAGLIGAIDKDVFRTLIEFMRQLMDEQRSVEFLNAEEEQQWQLMNAGCQRLMETVKGKQLHAIELMGMTEKQRQSKRLQAGLNALARGGLEGLRNKEVLLHLAATFERLILNRKENLAAAIVQTLVGGLKLEDEELRLRSGQGLGLISEKLVSLHYWEWLEKLTPTFLQWLRKAEEADATCHKIVVVAQEILAHAYKTEKEAVAEKILSLFYEIRSGSLGKSSALQNFVAQVQDKAVDRKVLQMYLERCFVKPVEEMHCQKIIMHGPLGVQFLLDALLVKAKRADRLRLLTILANVGGRLSPLLLERLQAPMPWYGKRNLLRLLSETGTEKDLPVVQGYLAHEDIRVQSEALRCINLLSAQKKKQYLLEALPRISEKLKADVVRALSQVVDEEVVRVLVELLQDEKYFSADIRTALLVSICETLGRSGSAQAQKALQPLSGKGGVRHKNMEEEVVQAAQKGLALLDVSRRQQKLKQAEVQKISKNALRMVQAAQDNAAKKYLPVTNLAEEHEIYMLLGQNKRGAAKELLLNLISTLTSLRQFGQAEALCKRLTEIDPLALDDILKATELIEEQKKASLDQGQAMSWVDVYDFLTTEEFNSLYSAMGHVTYLPDENIVVQGDLQQRLIFINKGRVKLFHRDSQGNDILLKIAGPGDVIGVDSFFKASVWTVNVASISTVEAFILPREVLRKWQNTFPDLDEKLKDFCQQRGEQDTLKVMAIDRRVAERWNFSGQLAITLFDEYGKATGTVLQGDKGDISVGGVFSSVRVLQKRNIRLLLGRKVLVSLLDGAPESQLTSGVSGFVVAVYAQDFSGGDVESHVQYAVHIQFDQPLRGTDLMAVVSGG